MLRVLRPLVKRYEILIAELTAYGNSLAERLEAQETEAEVARLRGHRETGTPGSLEGSQPSDSKATATEPS
jgi:hypothetical protein